MNKKLIDRKKRIEKLNKELKKIFPKVKIALLHKTPLELLIAVILSAQCTDKMVNKVTEELFKKYKNLNDYIKADIKEFEQDIKSTGFYKNKTKNILNTAKIIKENFGGVVPDNMNDLLKLSGVARKTANIVLSEIYGKNEGVAVDTHVRRFARKFELTDNTDPNKIEEDLMELLPEKEWGDFTLRVILYGREMCPARIHDCTLHKLTNIYPRSANNWPKSK